MQFTTLFFDLDDTLYPSTSGLWQAIKERMGLYMLEKLHIPKEEIPELRRKYYQTYGTTLRGLQRHHQVDSEDFLAFVHDLPLQRYLSPDPEIRSLICSLPQNKWIFTNADEAHARRVLESLNLANCFQGIIDVRALDYLCKPEKEAYRVAMRLVGESDPKRCILLDDSPRNLLPARAIGIITVLVGQIAGDPSADYTIAGLKDLPEVLPELWKIPVAPGDQ
jgi:putative hydrolase of the HAD superfamily